MVRIFNSWLGSIILLLVSGSLQAQPFVNGQNAEAVYGQSGSYLTGLPNQNGVTASSLNLAIATTVDHDGRLYVVEWKNHRVIRIDNPLISDVADAVFGQYGSFSTNDENIAGLSSQTLFSPTDALVDPAGRLYVADGGNNRVLRFDHPLTSSIPDAVYGQMDFVSNLSNRGGTPNAETMAYPVRIGMDSAGRLYVCDYSNFRILRFDDPLESQRADAVYGQPDLTSNIENNGGRSARSLSFPYGIGFDGAGHMYVADAGNSRVLVFDNPLTSAVADTVIGQPDFARGDADGSNTSPSSFHAPGYIGFDGPGRLYVCDNGNHRVLIFNDPRNKLVADRVIGQANFTDDGSRTVQNGLRNPQGIAIDRIRGKLYIADEANHRVLRFGAIGGGLSETPQDVEVGGKHGQPSLCGVGIEFSTISRIRVPKSP